jgi:DNA-binding response OmpR family regulator
MCQELIGKTILILDEQEMVRKIIQRFLEFEGFIVHETSDAGAALNVLEKRPIDLIVLGAMLPGVQELELLQHIRRRNENPPIILLTTQVGPRGAINAVALDAGNEASSLVDPGVLISRVQRVLQRASDALASLEEAHVLKYGDLRIDPLSRLVTVDSEPVSLTAREFSLLWFLARHPCQTLSREQILDHVWGYDFYGDRSTLTVHIRHLREKIEPDPSHPRHIVTVWGIGYRFDPCNKAPEVSETLIAELEQAAAKSDELDVTRRELVAWALSDLWLTLTHLCAMVDALASGDANDSAASGLILEQMQVEIALLRELLDERLGQRSDWLRSISASSEGHTKRQY